MDGVGLAAWHDEGRRVPVETPQGTRRVFLHEGGTGPHVTLLHGFPTSSWDWAPLVARWEGVEHLAVDHLGFGDSDKPRAYGYGFLDQLEVLRQVWRRRDVDETHLVAHDYSVSIAQEVLARIAGEDWRGPDVRGVTLLNGGLFYSAIDRKLVQDLLRWPLVGPTLARLLPYHVFASEFSDVFAPDSQPSPEQLEQHWEALTRRGGRGAIADVASYLDERREREERWTAALARPARPVRYVWGLRDPVSGPSILEALRERVPEPDVVELPDAGHYPQIEAPARVAREVRDHALPG